MSKLVEQGVRVEFVGYHTCASGGEELTYCE